MEGTTSSFGSRLKDFLDQEKISIEKFATQIHRSVDSVKGYLQSISAPKIDVILAIGKQYPHWSIKYLLGGQGSPIIRNQAPKEHQTAPMNEKESILRWLSLRNRIAQEIENLPLDGFHYLFSDVLEDFGQLLDENEAIAEELETFTKNYLIP